MVSSNKSSRLRQYYLTTALVAPLALGMLWPTQSYAQFCTASAGSLTTPDAASTVTCAAGTSNTPIGDGSTTATVVLENGATLDTTGSGAISSIFLDNATVTLEDTSNLNSGGDGVEVNGNANVTLNGGSTIMSAEDGIESTSATVILNDTSNITSSSGAGLETENGNANVTLNGSSSINASTTGVLANMAGDAMVTLNDMSQITGNSAVVANGGNATVTLNGSSLLSVSNIGVFTPLDNATVTLNDSSSITSSGFSAIVADHAVVTLNAGTTASGNNTLASDATIFIDGSDNSILDISGTVSNAGIGGSFFLGGGDDFVVLRTGASLSSMAGADFGMGTDDLELTGNIAEDEQFLNLENLTANAGIGNTVTLNGSSTTTVDTLDIQSGTFQLDRNLTTTDINLIAGNGNAVTFNGTSTLNATNLNLQSGSLQLDRDLTVTDVNVNTGGITTVLSGSSGTANTTNLDIQSGTFQLERDLNVTNAVTVADGATFNVNTSFDQAIFEAMTNTGSQTINISGMGTVLDTTGASGSRAISINDAIITLNDDVRVVENDVGNIGVEFSTGTITLNDSSQINTNGSAVIINGAGDRNVVLNDSSSITSTSNTAIDTFGSGNVTLNNTASIIAGGRAIVADTVILNGTSSIMSGSAVLADNATVAAGSTITASSLGGDVIESVFGNGVFDIAGTVMHTGTGSSFDFGGGDNQLILRTGSNIQSTDGGDFGGGNDTLTIIGNGSEDEQFLNLETIEVNADATGFDLNGSNSTFIDDLNVNTGLFSVNRDLFLSGTATVNSAGILGGTGQISGNITNNGTVAPGNSIGTQTIFGDFTQGAGGNLEIEFDNGTIDLLDITGNASLDGTVSFVEIGTGTLADTPLTFLQTTGTITGTFSGVNTTFLNGSDLATASIDVGAMAATVTFGTTSFTDEAETTGSGGLASVLDDALGNGTTGASDISTALLNASDLGDALESQGNIVGNSATFTANSAVGQVASIAQGRVSSFGGANQGGNVNFSFNNATPSELNQIATASGIAAGDDVTRGGLTFWSQAVAGFSDIDSDNLGAGAESDTYGVTFGVEKDYGTATTAGLFLGFTETDTDIDGLSDNSDIQNYQLGLYGAHRFTSSWHVNGTLSGSFLNFETARPTASGTAVADFDGFAGLATAELLYDVNVSNTTVVSPFVGIEASFVDRDGYSETGAGVLNNTVQSDTNEFLTSILGVQASSNFAFAGLNLAPSVKVGWARQYGDDNSTTTANFITSPSIAFTSQGADRNRNSLRLDFGFDLSGARSNKWGTFLRYTGDIASDAQDHIIRAGVVYRF